MNVQIAPPDRFRIDQPLAEKPTTGPTPRRPRLAIISTFDELCGIAAYTHFLVKQLEPVFDLEVLELDQYFLRNPSKRVQKLGDRHIRELCARLKNFDHVNIQLEHGTLGREGKDILRRFRMIANAAPSLTVTFHTIIAPAPLYTMEFWKTLMRLRPWTAKKIVGDAINARRMSSDIYSVMRRIQKQKPLNVIVHTRRDMRMMKYVNRFNTVYDHPLAFLSGEQAAIVRAGASRARFPVLAGVPADAKLVGVFGFFGRYKGFDTAIKALKRLPDDYHLLIFGGVHPNEIKLQQSIDPYIRSMLREANADTSVLTDLMTQSSEDEIDKRKSSRPEKQQAVPGMNLSVSIDSEMRDLLLGHPQDISRRMHFMGALDDDRFLAGMAICDTVVLPYLEVGQSSSGPMSQALEMGCRIIASRNNAFLQFARYHPDQLEFFDVGNHVELAQRLAAPPAGDPRNRQLAYGVDTNRALYLKASRATAAVTA